jgi:hypothetical protein
MYFFVIMIAVMAGFPPQLLLFVSVKWLVFILLYGGPKLCLISLVRDQCKALIPLYGSQDFLKIISS